MEDKEFIIEGISFKIKAYGDDELYALNEAKDRGKHLIGTYSYEIHTAHNPTGEKHIHLMNRGNEILSMNIGGSAHDGYHGARIPNKAYKELKKQLKDWNWPKDQILESSEYAYFLNKQSTNYLRPVKVSIHDNFTEAFYGFFHQFTDSFFQAGGGQGFIKKTVALIEDESGIVRSVSPNSIQFLDV